ncbi:MAG: HAD-IIA family hydrolase [Candidatus Nezhaarchaeales archaeon]|nr:MAG: HAD family hydrolase [Candidatus Nezhaarchaeota archaeon WYZ-LMO8]TDA36590.1 MAG: HAD family hydrolase [Candidatus Nezhaarchaeota archaeon WYZ-LMO7]
MPIKGLIVDLDGSVYIGDKPINGVPEALEELKRRGIKILFLTNNATKTPQEYQQKLESMGIRVTLDEILTSSMIAASYIKRIYGSSKIYVIGTKALEEVLRSYGHEVVDFNSNIVVVGLDFDFNYQKLSKALREIRRGARFIATNMDATIPVEGDIMPGAGSIVKAVEVASGVKPLVVGKPSGIALKEALRGLKLRPEEALVVGDRLETDIKMGRKFKCLTALVLTGVTKDVTPSSLPEQLRPHLVIRSLADLPRIISELP